MPKYKVKSTKKLYDKSTSRENSAPKDKCAVHEAKEGHLKESTLQNEANPSKVVTTVESDICSQCQVSGCGLIQCECCDLWYCNVCCGITEEALVLLGVVECLHFFCPCEGEVFKAVDRKVCEDSSAISQKDFLSTITDIISKAINDF